MIAATKNCKDGKDRSEWRANYYRANKHKAQEYFQKNKQAIYAAKRAAHEANPSARFAIQLRIKWGLTLEDFDRMLEEQGGCCAICRRAERSIDPRTGAVRRLAVDHCHSTNKIRGLLCSHCNRALGLLRDDPGLLQKAIDYLKENQ